MDGLGEYVSDGVVELDAEWKIRSVNPRGELLFGQRRAELVGRVWWELFPYLVDTAAEEQLRGAAAGTLVRRFRIFHPPRYAWHEVTAVPREGALTLVLNDVTDVVRARQTEAVRDAVREVIDQAPIAVSLLRGADHRVELMNQLARQIIGGQNLEGRSVRAALPELESQGLFELLDGVYNTGRPFQAREVPVRYDKSGTGELYEGWFDIVYQPTHDVNGRISGVLSLSVEVTELVAERRRIESRSSELEAVLSQLVEGVVITDSSGAITFVNDAARALHGVEGQGPRFGEAEWASSLFTSAGEPFTAGGFVLDRAVAHGETTSDARWRIRRPDGTEIEVSGGARPVVDTEGRRIAAVLTMRPAPAGE